jgi:hypothetical protein
MARDFLDRHPLQADLPIDHAWRDSSMLSDLAIGVAVLSAF